MGLAMGAYRGSFYSSHRTGGISIANREAFACAGVRIVFGILAGLCRSLWRIVYARGGGEFEAGEVTGELFFRRFAAVLMMAKARVITASELCVSTSVG
jgi:hypothetical protein